MFFFAGRYEVTAGDGHAMLVVHDAEKTDKGSYTILAENDQSKDSTTFNIAITGELQQMQVMLSYFDGQV